MEELKLSSEPPNAKQEQQGGDPAGATAPQTLNSNTSRPMLNSVTGWLLGALIAVVTSTGTWFVTYYNGHIEEYTKALTEAKGTLEEKGELWVKNAFIRSLPLAELTRTELIDSLIATRVAVSSLHTNDAEVDNLTKAYKEALEDALSAVSTFDGSREKLTNMINSLQHASNVGGELGNEIGTLNASFKRKFCASMINAEPSSPTS